MTIQELKDLIDSTINENGTKAITGQALNLALNEIVNAVAEAATTGGGGGVKRLYVNMNGEALTDPEQLASNAALYTEIVTALTNDEFPPQVGVLAVIDGTYQYMTSIMSGYDGSMLVLLVGMNQVTLRSDGNTEIGG